MTGSVMTNLNSHNPLRAGKKNHSLNVSFSNLITFNSETRVPVVAEINEGLCYHSRYKAFKATVYGVLTVCHYIPAQILYLCSNRESTFISVQ